VADLVINKPMGWSPKGIEFKRAHLYDINPVGVGAMVLASALGIAAHLGLFGPLLQAFSAMVALVTAFVTSPLIAWATQGRYYLARQPEGGAGQDRGTYQRLRVQRCVICEGEYEAPDMAHCPAYQGRICSLCCSLDARCGDLCKPQARLSVQWNSALRRITPRSAWPYLDAGLAHFALLMLVIAPVLAAVLGLLYQQELGQLGEAGVSDVARTLGLDTVLRSGFTKVYAVLIMVAAVVAWWLVLAHRSREVAQEESNRQTRLLMQEIESHRKTDEQLQTARLIAEQARGQADLANQAKTRYISNISHELRTPLNSILGYAQLLREDDSVPPHRTHAVEVIHRGGEHLLSLIEGTLDIARIESGRLTLEPRTVFLRDTVHEVASMFDLQAQAKGLRFVFDEPADWPRAVRADEKRLRQILINLLGNAVKFTQRGEVRLHVRHAREMALFEISDTGPGFDSAEVARLFEPFARAHGQPNEPGVNGGSGLGLTIAKMLTDLMGGELTAHSTPGQGATFRLRLFLPEVHAAPEAMGAVPHTHAPTHAPTPPPSPRSVRTGYEGPRRRILVVDNEETDRQLLARWLEPLGFEVALATHGEHALELLAQQQQQGAPAPDVVLMDLAMPGIDGWETLRRLQAMPLSPKPACAVVSANAFDKGLDNLVGLPPEDFLVKPVRREDLLRWLQQRLGLQWTHQTEVAGLGLRQCLEAADLQALLALARLGYYRGFLQQLDSAVLRSPACTPTLQRLRQQAREFQFDAIARQLQDALDGGPHVE
jgi:signal transduction histidine kinase/CheY-like chemotaxis protein